MPGSAVPLAVRSPERRTYGLHFPEGCARTPEDYNSQKAGREKAPLRSGPCGPRTQAAALVTQLRVPGPPPEPEGLAERH